MGPPLYAAEDEEIDALMSEQLGQASMGPPLYAAEDTRVGGKQQRLLFLLQWGRRSTRRKTIVPVDGSPNSKGASMGPPLYAAEDGRPQSPPATPTSSFNGAAALRGGRLCLTLKV